MYDFRSSPLLHYSGRLNFSVINWQKNIVGVPARFPIVGCWRRCCGRAIDLSGGRPSHMNGTCDLRRRGLGRVRRFFRYSIGHGDILWHAVQSSISYDVAIRQTRVYVSYIVFLPSLWRVSLSHRVSTRLLSVCLCCLYVCLSLRVLSESGYLPALLGLSVYSQCQKLVTVCVSYISIIYDTIIGL